MSESSGGAEIPESMQPFVKQLLDRLAGDDPLENGLYIVNVLHDEGCPAMTGGECCCAPDLGKIMPMKDVIELN